MKKTTKLVIYRQQCKYTSLDGMTGIADSELVLASKSILDIEYEYGNILASLQEKLTYKEACSALENNEEATCYYISREYYEGDELVDSKTMMSIYTRE